MTIDGYSLCPFDHPFEGAAVLYAAQTSSTMSDARRFVQAHPDFISGTVCYAGFQTQGRGRVAGRVWQASNDENLLCTTILKMKPPVAFTLRVGLALYEAFLYFIKSAKSANVACDDTSNGADIALAFKWPNDILYRGKKMSGILCESDGSVIYVGTGCNIAQGHFHPDLAEKATSLALVLDELGAADLIPSTQAFLGVYLAALKNVLQREDWKSAIEAILYQRNLPVSFLIGDPQKNERVSGILEGLSEVGEPILLLPSGERTVFSSGEFPLT